MAVTGKTIIGLETLLPETDPALWEITTAGAGPQGQPAAHGGDAAASGRAATSSA